MSAHKWAEVIKAWADGKAIQYRLSGYLPDEWSDFAGGAVPAFNAEGLEWRIKPERWYRVALLRDSISEWTTTADSGLAEGNAEAFKFFKGWLTERIYY